MVRRGTEAGDGKLIAEFETANATNRPAQIESRIRLLRRKDGADGGEKSYYEAVESAGSSHLAGRAALRRKSHLTGKA